MPSRKYFFNEHAFDEITEESAYWIGFLMADGCVHKVKNKYNVYTLSICLAEKDINQLKKFVSFMESSYPIHKINNTVRISMNISSLLKDKLISYGITPRKSLTTKVCDELAFNRDFWRGVIDGDGYLGISKFNHSSLVLVGSKYLLSQFSLYCSNITEKNHLLRKKENIFSIHFGSRIATKLIYNIYNGSTIYLDRKKEIAEKVINEFFSEKKKFYQHLSESEVQKIIVLYKNGAPIKKIAEEINVAGRIIFTILKKNGVERNRLQNEQKISAIINEYKNGKTIRSLSKKFSLGKDTISKYIKQNNIDIRMGRNSYMHLKEKGFKE